MMGLMRAYRAYWKNAFNFYNRTSRGDYWQVVFLNVAIGIALLVFMYISISGAGAGLSDRFLLPGPGIVVFVAWPFVNIVPQIAMTVRRLQDSGRGWYYYFFALIPLAGPIIMVLFLTSETQQLPGNKFGYRKQV